MCNSFILQHKLLQHCVICCWQHCPACSSSFPDHRLQCRWTHCDSRFVTQNLLASVTILHSAQHALQCCISCDVHTNSDRCWSRCQKQTDNIAVHSATCCLSKSCNHIGSCRTAGTSCCLYSVLCKQRSKRLASFTTFFLNAAAVDRRAIAPFCSIFIGVCVSYKNVSSCCLSSSPLLSTSQPSACRIGLKKLAKARLPE